MKEIRLPAEVNGMEIINSHAQRGNRNMNSQRGTEWG